MKQQGHEGQREEEGEADPEGIVQDGARKIWRIESAQSSSCILKERRCIAALSQSYLRCWHGQLGQLVG